MGCPLVYILILNWNGHQDTIECVESCKRLNYSSYKILIIDNGSYDNSESLLRTRFPHIEIIQTGQNLGYAGGNNIGIAYAIKKNADYIMLLNNDVIVPPNLIDILVNTAVRLQKRAILGPKVYQYSKKDIIWCLGGKWNCEADRFDLLGYGLDDSKLTFNTTIEVDSIVGCCLFIAKHFIDDVGLLDEKYFLIHEESDWCYRGKKKGYKAYCVTDAKVWHKGCRSFGGTTAPLIYYYDTRNRALWAKKHLAFHKRIRVYAKLLKEVFLLPPLNRAPDKFSMRGLYYKIIGMFSAVKINRAKLLGLIDYFLRRFGPCPYSL